MGSWELDVERGSNPGPWCPLGSFLVLPFRELPGSRHGTRTRQPLAPRLTLSGQTAARRWSQAAPLAKLRGGRRKGKRETAQGHAWGWGEGGLEKKEGEPSTCSVPRQEPDQGRPPPGSPRPGPQQPSRPTDMNVHTHSHTHGNHTHTHTHPSSHSDLVLKTQACVNSVKRSAQQEFGRMSPFHEAGPLGFFSFCPLPPLI